jgi:hypothetical protein
MSWVDPQPGLSLQDGGNPGKCPQIVGEPVGLRTIGEKFAQGDTVGFLDLGRLSQGTTLPRQLALGIEGATPTHRRGRRDFALPGDLCLGNSPGQQCHALLPVGLHGVKVAFRWPRIPDF